MDKARVWPPSFEEVSYRQKALYFGTKCIILIWFNFFIFEIEKIEDYYYFLHREKKKTWKGLVLMFSFILRYQFIRHQDYFVSGLNTSMRIYSHSDSSVQTFYFFPAKTTP